MDHMAERLRRSQDTIDSYRSFWNRANDYLGGDDATDKLSKVTFKELLAYQSSLSKGHSEKYGPLVPNSARMAIVVLKVYFRFLVLMDIRADDPTAKIITPEKDLYFPRPIPEDDLAIAMREATAMRKHRVRLALGLARGASFRCKEVASLPITNLRLRPAEEATALIFGKGRKQRLEPLTGWVLYELDRYWEHHPRRRRGTLITNTADTEALTSNALSHEVSAFFKSLDMPYTLHQARHSFATKALESPDADIYIVSQLMGHSSTAVTQVYAQIAEGRKRRALVNMSMPDVGGRNYIKSIGPKVELPQLQAIHDLAKKLNFDGDPMQLLEFANRLLDKKDVA